MTRDEARRRAEEALDLLRAYPGSGSARAGIEPAPAHDAALRAALARETERAERAERERDEARGVQIGMLKRTADRAERAESERDSLRSQLDALGNDLTLTRGAMAADDARLREAAIRVWGEHVRGCDTPDEMADLIRELRRQLAALSHLGTGAGRRAG